MTQCGPLERLGVRYTRPLNLQPNHNIINDKSLENAGHMDSVKERFWHPLDYTRTRA